MGWVGLRLVLQVSEAASYALLEFFTHSSDIESTLCAHTHAHTHAHAHTTQEGGRGRGRERERERANQLYHHFLQLQLDIGNNPPSFSDKRL